MPFASITIDINPVITNLGPFTITWHGLFTAVGIALAVLLAAWIVRDSQIPVDDVYAVALPAVLAGIVGARLLYVIEHASYFFHRPLSVFAINEGGISIYGAVILGPLVAYWYARRYHMKVREMADVGAIAMLTGQAIGRIGDLINGEHWSRATSLPWGVRYTNPDTLAQYLGQTVQPVVSIYEPLLLVLIAGVVFWMWRRGVKPGYGFWLYVLGYAQVRFWLSFLRLNETKVGPISVPQIIAVVMTALALLFLYRLRRIDQREAARPAPEAPAGPSQPRPRPRPSRT